MRPTLLRVLTDLYVQRLAHTPDEERRYTELALRLLDAVDVPTRVAVATRLARLPSPPPRVVRYLARDLPEVAASLRPHPLSRPSAAADAPAPVAPLHPAPTPVAPGIPAKAHTITETPGVVGSSAASDLNERFFAANAHERRLILLNFDIVVPPAAGRIGVSRDPSVGQRLEAAALGRNREGFAQQLALALRIARAQAQRIARDDLGETVAVAAKALGLRRDMLCRILMFINPAVGHSVERIYALAALYDEMSTTAAEGMVAIWQALPRSDLAGAKYQPASWDDTRARARPATSIQHAPAAPRTSEQRNAS